MRRFDKKKNLAKVNLLTEQRYLQSKGLVTENLTTEDGLVAQINDAFKKIENGTPNNETGIGALLTNLKDVNPEKHSSMIEKYREVASLNEDYKFTDLKYITFVCDGVAYGVGELKNKEESSNGVTYTFGLDKYNGNDKVAVGGQIIYQLDKENPQESKLFINSNYHGLKDIKTKVEDGEEVFNKMTEYIQHNP